MQSTFHVNLHVKTLKQVYALDKPRDTCQLLDTNTIKFPLKTGHNFIHLGFIQVGIKPLTQQDKNTFVLLCLRDARFLDYNDSLMGMMETGLHRGPVHFNCFPDFTLSLRDPYILDVLTLNIQLNGSFTNMKEKVHNIALIYRIYYKCIKTNLNVQALHKSPKDKTLLIQSSSNDTNINIPKMIEQKDITLPD